jgi:hypothetical protein
MLWMIIKNTVTVKFVVFFGVFVIGESFCHARYLIELNTGAKFVTSRYWQEKDQVWFQQSGGLIAVFKKQVKTIQESEVQQPIQTDESTPNRNPANPGRRIDPAPTADRRPEVEKNKTFPGSAPAPEIQKEAGIEDEFAGLKQRVAVAEDLETTALYRLTSDMTHFRNHVLSKNLGHIYSDKLLELTGMFDTMEDIIKSRNQ